MELTFEKKERGDTIMINGLRLPAKISEKVKKIAEINEVSNNKVVLAILESTIDSIKV